MIKDSTLILADSSFRKCVLTRRKDVIFLHLKNAESKSDTVIIVLHPLLCYAVLCCCKYYGHVYWQDFEIDFAASVGAFPDK